MKISGTVFRDGDIRFDDDGSQIVHYQGRGVLWSADEAEIDEIVCAGGSGTTDCSTNMASWDPATNFMVLVSNKNVEYDTGGSTPTIPGAFQGVIYSTGTCLMHEGFKLSGPAICNRLDIASSSQGWPTFYTWPPFGSLLDGQIYANTATATAFNITLGSADG